MRHARTRQRGLAAVELALLMPIFLLTAYATAELGRALYQFNILSKSVRDGAQYLARYGSVAGVMAPSGAQITTAKNLVVYGSPVTGTALLPDLKTSDVTITPKVVAPSLTANYIEISATYTFESKFSGVIPVFGLGDDIAAPGTYTATIRMKAL